MLYPQSLIKKQYCLTRYCFCTQVHHFGPCETGAASLNLSSAHILITRQNGLTCYFLCVQVDRFSPCECLSLTLVLSVIKGVSCFLYFICKIGKGVRKVPLHRFEMRIVFFQHTLGCHDIYNFLTSAGKNRSHFKSMRWDYSIF